MRKSRIGAVVAVAAAAAMLGAGTAQALGPAPTANFQMCGIVYSDGALAGGNMYDMHSTTAPGDPTTGSVGAGYKVTGTLSFGGTYTGTTNSAGEYCMQGDAVMAGSVGLGATVSITQVKNPAGVTTAYRVFHPTINQSTFAAHVWPTNATSASGFHVKI